MILLITPLAKAHDCVLAIEEATGEAVRVCSALQPALAELQAQEFTAVVLDQLWLDAEPHEGSILKYLGSAVPVYMNFAVSGTGRVVRELRSALQRRGRELLAARRDAEQSLRHELKDAVTALLLSCEMALQVPSLPPLAQDKMQTAEALARDMSMKLGGAA
jgi:hypothetical protein